MGNVCTLKQPKNSVFTIVFYTGIIDSENHTLFRVVMALFSACYTDIEKRAVTESVSGMCATWNPFWIPSTLVPAKR